jgi:hypothetical protein
MPRDVQGLRAANDFSLRTQRPAMKILFNAEFAGDTEIFFHFCPFSLFHLFPLSFNSNK